MRTLPKLISALLLVGTAATLCGCGETPVEEAERRLKRIEQSGNLDEICQAKRDVAKAHLDSGSQFDYDRARLDARIACQSADIAHMEGRE